MKIKIKKIFLNYEERGTGTPVIILHGWGVDHNLMLNCLEPVFNIHNHDYRRIYLDLPGMGKSGWKKWVDGSDKMLDIILDFINKATEGNNFILIGESYGGYLARGILKKQLKGIAGLLLLCPLFKPYTVHDNYVDKGDTPAKEVLEKDEKFLSTLNKDEYKLFHQMAVIETQTMWKHFKKDVIPGIKSADTNFLNNYLGKKTPFSFKVDDLPKKFLKPALIMTGRQDHAVGYKDIYKILENFPRATFAVLDKAGHNLQFEQESLFKSLTLEWLERIRKEDPEN